MDPSHPVTKPLTWRSLQTRITLLTLCVLVGCIWSLYAYVSRQLHDDVERMVGEQQRATVALHASEINRSLYERQVTLEKVTQLFAPAMTASRDELQTLMNERPALPAMFNGGFFITDTQGTAIASIPVNANRVGLNYLERDHVSSALKDGKSKVSKPALGKALNSPVVSIAVPIRDAQGKILGALVGVIDLAKPNFMDAIMSARYGKSGGYILIAKQWRQVVTATQRDRSLQSLPATGTNPDIDRYMKDFEGTSVLFDPQGVQVMASAASVRVADWVLVAALPVEEAFAPVHNLNRNMAVAALVASLLAGALIWWLLRYQLSPLHTAFRALRQHARSADLLKPLPKAQDDEIGLLIDGFNRLLLDLNGREADLARSQEQMRELLESLRDAQHVAQLGNWTLSLSTGALRWSDEIFRIFEIDSTQFGATYEAFLGVIHPEDRERVNQAFSESLVNRLPYQIRHRLRMPDGRVKWVEERCRSEFDATGKALRSVGTVQDITEQKLAETALADSRDLLMTVIDLIPMRVFWKDTELRYLGCNTVFAQDAGLQHPSELIGKNDYAMGWAAQADVYRADDRSVIEEGRIKLFYDEMQTTPSGRTIFLRTSKMPLRSQSGGLIGVLGVYEDVTQRKAAEMQVRQLSLIVEQSSESILITDLDGNIQYVNQTFEQTTGYARAEVIGHNPRLLRSGRTSSKTYEALWYALKNGQNWTGELINRRKDASVYVDRAQITPLRDQDGTISSYVAVQRDITEEKSIAQELDNYRHSLETQVTQRTEDLTRARLLADEANRAKSEFLANMSHEIRTPMNGVVGMVEVLRQTGLDASQMRMLDTISHSSMALLGLLNDILDFSKIEAGKLDIEQVPTPLREIVEEVVLLMLHQALHKNVELSLFVDPTLPRWVLSDPTRLRQILLNLLGNALKFVTPSEGKVAIHVQPSMRADGSAWFALTVMDNGIGMSAGVLDKLFQPFRQADASTVRKFGGTGLGLSITQRLVDMMDGQIRVKSAPGSGSEFRVDLPLLQAMAQVNQVSSTVPDLTGLSVVLVSQELACSTLVQSYLGSAGARVSVLPDLPVAQRLLDELPPDAVLLIDAVRTGSLPCVAEAVAPARVVYLVHRTRDDITASVACVPVGPLLYLDLLRSVARASGQSGHDLPDWTNPASVVKQRKAPSVQEARRTGHLILMAEDNETNRDVMKEQLRLLGYAAEVAEDGEAALRMWEKSDYALLLTDCHMPRMDGFELTAAIRQAEPPGTHLPIVAITANALQGEAQRCRDRGMDDYLCKPLQMAQLGAMLDKWLPLPAQAPALSTWDASALNALVGPNPVLHARLLDKFVANAQKQVTAIESAAAVGDCASLAGVAHALKSAARSVGALALGELCERLEATGRANDSAACHELAQQLREVFALAAQHIAARDNSQSGTNTPGDPHEV